MNWHDIQGLAQLSTEAIEKWLRGHDLALRYGIPVGHIDRQKAQAFRLELIKRGDI